MAPEVLALNPYNFQADIWSLGVVLFQMIFGEYPFKSTLFSICRPQHRKVNKIKVPSRVSLSQPAPSVGKDSEKILCFLRRSFSENIHSESKREDHFEVDHGTSSDPKARLSFF